MGMALENISRDVDGQPYIHPTTLNFEPGHFNVLLGATGAGKTTLIRLMAGLDKPSAGTIRLHGKDITRLSVKEREISLVHQFFVNYPHMSVFDNIASPLRAAGKSRAESMDRVQEAAALLRLEPFLERLPHELSGGQQQRTALARAIAKDSKVIFLDEPLANLDYKLREELREELPQMFAGRGAIVVYATSEPEEALLLGGHTVLMQQGEVVQSGATARIYEQPASLSSVQVFSDPPANIAGVVKRGVQMLMGKVEWNLAGSGTARLPDGEYTLAVRPDHLATARTGGHQVKLTGQVRVTELSGSDSSAHVAIDGAGAGWVVRVPGTHPFKVGSDLALFLDPSHCFLFHPDGSIAGGTGQA